MFSSATNTQHRAVSLRLSVTLALLAPVALAPLAAAPAHAATVTPDGGAVWAAAFEGAASSTLPSSVTVSGTQRAVTWNSVDTSKVYTTQSVTGALDGGDTVTASVEIVPKDPVYFIDSGGAASTSPFNAVKALAGTGDGATLLNAAADQQYTGSATWGYDLNGTTGGKADWVAKTDAGTSKDATGLYADDNPASYVLDLAKGKYSITVGAYEWWNSPGRKQQVYLVDPDGNSTTIVDSAQLVKNTIVTNTALISAKTAGKYRLWFKEVSGGYPVVSWIGVAKVASTTIAPVIDPASGTYTATKTVKITSATSGASIYYTLDGTDPTTASTKYIGPFKVTQSTTVKAVAAVDDDVSNITTAKLTIAKWAATATPFKLAGGSAADNVKLTWGSVDGATGYEVFRDGASIGKATGDTFDDYGIGVGTQHSYVVKASDADGQIAATDAVTATGFTPSGTPAVWDNTANGNDLGLASGIKVGSTYYKYATSSSDGTTTITEATSTNGRDFGSPRTLTSLTDTKLEGFRAYWNPTTSKVILGAHRENASDYTQAKLFLAQVTPGGTLDVTYSDQPFGNDSRDMSLFIDTDQTAYAVTATNTNADIAIYKLNTDWTAPESKVATVFKGESRETPQIVKREDTYYFFSSKASGWLPSQAKYASAASLAGPWSDLREIGNAATYGTQFTSVEQIGDSYAMYGYRWGSHFTPAESTGDYPRLLPVTFNEGFASAEYYSTVEYYPGTGLVPVQSGRLASLGKPVTASVDAASANNDESVVTDGADLTSSGFFRSGNEGSSTAYPYDLTIDLKTAYRLAEIDTTTFLYNGSEAAYKYKLSASLDGSTWTQLVDGTSNTRVGYLIDKVTNSGSFRFVKLTVLGVTKVKDGGSVTGWGDGLYEVAVFGAPQATPVADLAAGTYYTAKTVKLSSSDAGASIHYTLDGSTPTAQSPTYTDPISLTDVGDHTLKAVAVNGSTVSDVFSATYAIRSGDTPVKVDETPAYAVVAGQTPDLPTTVRVVTAAGGTRQANVTWDLSGMQFTKPYKSYTIYGTVEGLAGYVTGSIETLAPDTVYYVDSGTTSAASTAYTGAKWLLGDKLLNDASDQAKTSSNSWGYSGQDGAVTDAGPKEVNGLYGQNNAGNTITYTLNLADPGDYTLAMGIYEWWSGTDRQVKVTLVDAKGTSHDVVTSDAGAINGNNRSASIQGTFTLPADAAGVVQLKITNVTWQGATVTWFGVAKGAQTLDLSADKVDAPAITPAADQFYGTPKTITITGPAGAAVYYTTDGSTPSRINGTRYTDPFLLSTSATVNAVAIINGVTSAVTSADYTIVVRNGDYTSVPVGQAWFDTNNNPIQAHGGGFLEHDGWYYWVGEDKANNSASFNGINLYRSKDLLNWQFVAQILKPEADKLDCGVTGNATCKVERPKLLYNDSTKTFVLWGHWETAADYAASQVVVATSPTIDGQYAVQYHNRPGVGKVWDLEQTDAINATVTAGTYPDFDTAAAAYQAKGNTPAGHQSRDLTVYVDAKGRGWLISAEANVQLRIYPLSADFLTADYANSYPLFVDEAREAEAITQVDGVYYLFTSGQSGWYANQLKYAYTTDLSDPNGWTANANVGNNTTFKSQPTNILQLQKAGGGSSLVYMGDRWVPDALGKSTYIWLPMSINSQSHAVTLNYTDGWSLNTQTGDIIDHGATLLSQGKPASATPTGSLSDGYTDGVADPGEDSTISPPARAANDGIAYTTNRYDNSHYFYPGSTASYTWQVDLEKASDLSRVDVSWRSYNGSETYSAYVLAGSNDGVTWTTLKDRTSNKVVGFTSDQVAGRYRYVRLSVSNVVNDHNGSQAGWAAGLVEVQVYGSTVPESVSISGDHQVASGGTATLTASVLPAGSPQAVTWSSDNTDVLTVEPDGTVHGITAGTATITATSAEAGVSASVTIEVVPAETRTKATLAGRTVTATVTAAGGGTVTGAVTFAAGAWSREVTLSGGTASVEVPADVFGTVTVSYAGVAGKLAGSSTTVTGVVNLTGLAAVIGAATGLKQSDYTDASWQRFAAALAAAKAAYADPQATQARVDAAAAALTAAQAGLVTAPPAIATTTTFTVSPTSVRLNASGTAKVTVKATVTAANKKTVNTGMVVFTAGSSRATAAVVNGRAATTLTLTKAGTLTVTAQYLGTPSYKASTAAKTVKVKVAKARSATKITVSHKTIRLGRDGKAKVTVTVKVTVEGRSKVANGTVRVQLAGVSKTVKVVSGVAKATLAIKKKGTFRAKASFAGNATTKSSTGYSGKVTVRR